MKCFISYSHRDQALLERLHTHLAMLKRQGLDAWYDREILAGGALDQEIARELDSCDLFLALVTPDFLNSQYCYEREMKTALRRHDEGGLVVVPVIGEACDWQSSPLANLKVVPRDGKAITEWVNVNTAFMDVVSELRRVVESKKRSISGKMEIQRSIGEKPAPAVSAQLARNRYRVPKSFDDIDRADFVSAAFAKIADYFVRSIDEIDSIDGMRGRYRKLSEVGFTCTILNKLHNDRATHITVHRGGRESMGSLGEITYSFVENGPPNQAHGWINVDSDDYQLFLVINSFGHERETKGMTPEQAAAWLWETYIKQAGITNE